MKQVIHTEIKDWVIFASCVAASTTIWLPFKEKAFLLLLGVISLFIAHKQWSLRRELKLIIVGFILYLVIFTIISEDAHRSIKGLYDITRGLLLLPIGILIGRLWSESTFNHYTILVIPTIVLMGNFFYPVHLGGSFFYFGYEDKPNSAGEVYLGLFMFFFMALGATKERPALLGVIALLFMTDLLGMILTNSRGVWLALFSSLLTFLIINTSITLKQKLTILLSSSIIFAYALLVLNHKGLGLALRDNIWANVFTSVTEHSPFLGFGINFSDFPEIGLEYNHAHNMLLELYASSGIVGLCILFSLLYLLVRHLIQLQFDRNMIFYGGVMGFVAFIIIGSLNVRFSSFSLIGSLSLFFGLFYSQSKEPAPEDRITI
jgi:hypothetical protein